MWKLKKKGANQTFSKEFFLFFSRTQDIYAI